MTITLEELLEARDNRRLAQLSLIEANPGMTLVVLTVNIPGSENTHSPIRLWWAERV